MLLASVDFPALPRAHYYRHARNPQLTPHALRQWHQLQLKAPHEHSNILLRGAKGGRPRRTQRNRTSAETEQAIKDGLWRLLTSSLVVKSPHIKGRTGWFPSRRQIGRATPKTKVKHQRRATFLSCRRPSNYRGLSGEEGRLTSLKYAICDGLPGATTLQRVRSI